MNIPIQTHFCRSLLNVKQALIALLVLFTSTLNAQTNIAPLAVAGASTCNTGPCSALNNLVFGTCGTQEMWITTAAPPNGTEWLEFVWPTAQSMNKITIHHAQTTGRFLAGGIIQRWNGSAYVNHHTFSGLNQANCINDVTFPTMTSTRLRITGFVMGPTGQNSNVNFREIEVWNAPPPGGGGPVLPPIANFFPSQATTSSTPTDTVWINSPYDLVSTSTNATRSFWDLPGENPLLPGYARGPVANTTQQYIDTAKYNTRFRYTYKRRGFWPVRLLAVSDVKRDSLRDSVVRFIYVDTPSTTPKPNFFAARRKVGIGDFASLVDITSGGPNQWFWTFDPPCNLCTTPPYFNNFFAGQTDQNPLFFGGDPGKFTVCLQAWNDRGSDTVCKKDYIQIINSINICSGSGASKSSEQEGFMFAASGPGLSYTRTQLTGCPGFLIEPCGDSVILWVERIKMLPSDSLVIHNGTSATAPILRTIGGNNVNTLPLDILRNGIRGGSRLFVRFKLGTAGVPAGYDSAGFAIRWETLPPSYGAPVSRIQVQDTIFSLQPVVFSNTSTGVLMKYAWDTDGNNLYDSINGTVTRTFLVTAPYFRNICLVTYNCVGSDTSCKNVLFLPTSQRPTPRFDADKVQGFNTDTFRFMDKSLFGPSTWRWTFTPGTAQYLMGTSNTSKNPIMRFTQRTKYTVKLVVSNQFGVDSITKVDYVNIGAYDQPQCLSDINLADGSIGITRVRLQSGIDTAINATTPCFQIVGGTQAASMFRGSKHALEVVRPATTSPMDRKAWIDFNMDGLFTNDELVMNEMNAQNLTRIDTILVSNTQRLGSTRMRVGVTFAGTTLNPSVTFMGVFRDYVVNFPMDTVKPVMSLNGGTTVFTEINKPYAELGVTATDNIEGNISAKFETLGMVDNTKVGPNALKYIVRDLYGNVSDTLYRTVFVILNQTGPSLVLDSPSTVYVEVYNKFTEPGFTARDNQGNLINNQVIITSNLDTSILGTYSATYSVTDAFGLNVSRQRAIIVGDTTRPVVTPKSNPYVHQVGTALDVNSIVNVTDNYWPTSFITLTTQGGGAVDVNKVGSYFVSYVARDNSGNLSNQVTVRIDVRDTRPPSLVLKGTNPMNWEVKTQFIDPGVTVSDNYWPAATVVVSKRGTVNVNVLGTYTIWYIATDPSGNKDSLMRTVNVLDRTAPVIDLLNVFTVNLPRWQVYVDPPIVILDNYNTDKEMRDNLLLITQNSLPLNLEGKRFGDVPGLFSITYRVKDLSGNQSKEAKRTINVLPEGGVGLTDVMNLDGFMSIYPNPSFGKINLRLAGSQSEPVEIMVYDMIGKLVHETQIQGNNLQANELDLTTQPKGFYLIKVQSGEKVFARKIQIN
jgi:PKD repeat protein